jgi:hypothetical protein
MPGTENTYPPEVEAASVLLTVDEDVPGQKLID